MPTLNARTTTVTLFQGDDFDREAELRRALEQAAVKSPNPARLNEDSSVAAAAVAYDEFVAEAAERGVTVTLRALKRNDWREVVSNHPPREDHEGDASWGFNYETLADDLVPLSVQIDGQFKDARERDDFLDELSDADFSALYSAAVRLNQTQGPDPKASVSSRLGLTGDATSERPTRLG